MGCGWYRQLHVLAPQPIWTAPWPGYDPTRYHKIGGGMPTSDLAGTSDTWGAPPPGHRSVSGSLRRLDRRLPADRPRHPAGSEPVPRRAALDRLYTIHRRRIAPVDPPRPTDPFSQGRLGRRSLQRARRQRWQPGGRYIETRTSALLLPPRSTRCLRAPKLYGLASKDSTCGREGVPVSIALGRRLPTS